MLLIHCVFDSLFDVLSKHKTNRAGWANAPVDDCGEAYDRRIQIALQIGSVNKLIFDETPTGRGMLVLLTLASRQRDAIGCLAL